MEPLARAVAGLGYDVVDVAGFVDQVAAQAHEQLSQVDTVQRGGQAVVEANQGLSQALGGVAVTLVEEGLRKTTGAIDQAQERINALIDRSEAIVQQSAALGAASEDSDFIASIQEQAGTIGTAFELAVETGRISDCELFDMRYAPIAGTDPQQHRAPFTKLTDDLLPPFAVAVALTRKWSLWPLWT